MSAPLKPGSRASHSSHVRQKRTTMRVGRGSWPPDWGRPRLKSYLADLVRGGRVPMPWVQRLGYLLELIGEAPKAGSLRDYVRAHAHEAVALALPKPLAGHPRDRDWKLIVNAHVEAEA